MAALQPAEREGCAVRSPSEPPSGDGLTDADIIVNRAVELCIRGGIAPSEILAALIDDFTALALACGVSEDAAVTGLRMCFAELKKKERKNAAE